MRQNISKPYFLFCFLGVVLGLMLSLSSDSWVGVWAGFEVNLYSVTPLLCGSMSIQEVEGAVKYFVTQMLASSCVVFGVLFVLLGATDCLLILYLGVLFKVGLVPGHFWLPSVMNMSSNSVCWLLATVQKGAPVCVLVSLWSPPLLVFFCSSMSSILGGVGGLNQTLIRPLLAYSSIGHMGWVFALAKSSESVALFYFCVYILVVSSVFLLLSNMYSSSCFQSNSVYLANAVSSSFLFMMINLSGLPPFLGFYPKVLGLMGLVFDQDVFLSITLILGTTMNIYYYLKVMFAIILFIPINKCLVEYVWYAPLPVVTFSVSMSAFLFQVFAVLLLE